MSALKAPLIEKRWKLIPADEQVVAALQDALKIHPVLCRLLVQRGITTYEDARKFFRPQLTHLHNPFLMKGMAAAVNRLADAMQRGEKILVYGDYDVDGTTAIALVYSFLKELYEPVDFYVPHRYREGYGISTQSIDFAAANGFSLIIALDCGIKAADKVAYARSKNIDYIICDHHLPGSEIPAAVAVLDPKQNDCRYPYKELSGCGIGFKLCQAFAKQQCLSEQMLMQYLDLVCVSIACDIVPITGENRVLAYYGLQQLNTSPCKGLRTLLQVAAFDKTLSISDIVFLIGPRINAAGRVDDARHAVNLLITGQGDITSALDNAEILQQLNGERKNLDKAISQEALEMILQDERLQHKKSTVLYNPRWHKGVVGIVASRLIESYYRPTIVLTESDGKISGSARSVKGFDLYEALYECRDLLFQFGGHRAAAGMTLLPENLSAFIKRFEEVVSARISAEQLIPEIEIDAHITLNDITPTFHKVVNQMAPFGPENMKPQFLLCGLRDSGYSRLVKEEHIKFSLRKQNHELVDGIGFGLASKFELLQQGAVDICCTIEENDWQDRKRLQLVVKDIRATELI